MRSFVGVHTNTSPLALMYLNVNVFEPLSRIENNTVTLATYPPPGPLLITAPPDRVLMSSFKKPATRPDVMTLPSASFTWTVTVAVSFKSAVVGSGNSVDCEAGSLAGSEAGSLAGSEAGSDAGSEAGSEVGSDAAS